MPKSAAIILKKELGIETILPDSHGWTNRFEIPSESGENIYRIAMKIKDGTWGCSCKGWIFNHAKPGFQGCKHLKALQPVLNQISGTQENPAIAAKAKQIEAAKKSSAFKFLYQNTK